MPVLDKDNLWRWVLLLSPSNNFLNRSRGICLMLFQLRSLREGSLSTTCCDVRVTSVSLSGNRGSTFFGGVAFTTDSNFAAVPWPLFRIEAWYWSWLSIECNPRIPAKSTRSDSEAPFSAESSSTSSRIFSHPPSKPSLNSGFSFGINTFPVYHVKRCSFIRDYPHPLIHPSFAMREGHTPFKWSTHSSSGGDNTIIMLNERSLLWLKRRKRLVFYVMYIQHVQCISRNELKIDQQKERRSSEREVGEKG